MAWHAMHVFLGGHEEQQWDPSWRCEKEAGHRTCMVLLWFKKSTTGHMAYHLTFWDSTKSYSRLKSAAAMAPFCTCSMR